MTEHKRKLIEVALPLDEINAACKADKDRKTGTIRNLHKWFAPMPLPAWRALLFAALVDDPEDDQKRAELFDLVRRLVASGAEAPDQQILNEANAILRRENPQGLPTILDPFCGGGSTLVEAQRLGLDSRGSDLNPVPVLISKTLTELLPPFANHQPIGPEGNEDAGALLHKPKALYANYAGVAEDVRRYAKALSKDVYTSLQDHYLTENSREQLQWLWARTVPCPNPACGRETILTTNWWLSKRKGDMAWIEPVVDGRVIRLDVVTGQTRADAPPPSKIGDAVFRCIACEATLTAAYIRSQGQAGRLGMRMTAVVERDIDRKAKAKAKRYRAATPMDVACANASADDFDDDLPELIGKAAVSLPLYGLTSWGHVHTPRQRRGLRGFALAIAGTSTRVMRDGGTQKYAQLITSLLTLSLGKLVGYMSTLARVENGHGGSNRTVPAFGRHDLPMTWDFVEINPFASIGASWGQVVNSTLRALDQAPTGTGTVAREDARKASLVQPGLVATDPPYFEAIGYADLADYYYYWHRQALRNVFPGLYATVATPKSSELTALSWHHGGSQKAATDYFVTGFTDVFENLKGSLRKDLPMIVVYASKEQKATASEIGRWLSILTSMIRSGLQITGTWPVNGTGGKRLVGLNANAVATYVAMVARPRSSHAGTCSLGEFNRALRRELPSAILALQSAGVLPVDMAQAVMGPGMSIFSRFAAVVDQEGRSITVAEALRLINSVYAEVEEEQEGQLDPDSQFAVAWWHKHGWVPGSFGEADALARPKGTSVDNVARAGVIAQHPNKVTALGDSNLERTWDPVSDIRPTSWEAVHHLVDRLVDGGGEVEAARLLARVDEVGLADSARMLTYRLASIAASMKRTKDEERYNALIEAWPRLVANAPKLERLF